jgi:hypothetical protein
VNLRGFPRRTLRADRPLYRIHRADHDPWWFSNDGSGRFDPVGSDDGACYLAEDPLASWLEVFRTPLLISEKDVRARTLLCAPLGRDLKLADLTSRRALAFNVTASLGADEDYTASQAFALDALQAGYDGVRYLVRHDPAQRLRGVALFGPAGAPDRDDPAWPAEPDEPIPPDLVEWARRSFGYKVLPAP